jgi:hypothetical protein
MSVLRQLKLGSGGNLANLANVPRLGADRKKAEMSGGFRARFVTTSVCMPSFVLARSLRYLWNVRKAMSQQ